LEAVAWKVSLFIFLSACSDPYFDYKTEHGIGVVLGEINHPAQYLVESWTEETISLWHTSLSWNVCIAKAINGTMAIFSDDLVIMTADNRRAWAACDPALKILILGAGSRREYEREKIVRLEFMHELSHVITFGCNGLGEEAAHKLYRLIGAGF
jgi:hypothetical protein